MTRPSMYALRAVSPALLSFAHLVLIAPLDGMGSLGAWHHDVTLSPFINGSFLWPFVSVDGVPLPSKASSVL